MTPSQDDYVAAIAVENRRRAAVSPLIERYQWGYLTTEELAAAIALVLAEEENP